eukprot:gnl/TRDRNA2_/TRDRNA2_51438_c0_seq1.p1 gnl/TRDRNA2_/TRDRNA2_51438_c0~~gnl/TRDRNA2_/TRDRNA2_51438_c0_seq1.p1  ORF type:complete len:443 (+),score=58.23 gnl/TRDRNA2_/TRDRNA2_51438_c0_seq1:3-1331(+)
MWLEAVDGSLKLQPVQALDGEVGHCSLESVAEPGIYVRRRGADFAAFEVFDGTDGFCSDSSWIAEPAHFSCETLVLAVPKLSSCRVHRYLRRTGGGGVLCDTDDGSEDFRQSSSWIPCWHTELARGGQGLQKLDSADASTDRLRTRLSRLLAASLGPPAEAAFIPIVSLGSWCGMKAACRGMGIHSPTLPFDWVRITIDGVLDALRSDFAGFLEYHSVAQHGFATPNEEVFVAQGHSFWHDNLREEATRDKYARRIARIRSLFATVAARRTPVIFARAVATTLELFALDELLSFLVQSCWPAPVRLMVLLDSQPEDGAMLVEDRPEMLICKVSKNRDRGAEYSVKEPPYVSAYHDAIRSAIEFTAHGVLPQDTRRVPLSSLLDAGNGLIRHVSLCEDLKEPWSHDPHMPPSQLVQRILTGPDCAKKRIVAEMIQAHVEALFS